MAPVTTSASPSAMVPRNSRLFSLMISFLARLSSVICRCPVERASAPCVSIHVTLIAAGFSKLFQLGAACLIIPARGLGENAAEHHVDVARHALHVAAHVDVGALVDPLQKVDARFPQSLLY